MQEKHPYGEFIPQNARAMIVGSFPIGKFTDPKRRKEIKSHEFDFFFGGEKNLLWKLLGAVFHHPVTSKEDIKNLLTKKKLAVGDVISSCRRKKGGASDSDLYDIEWNTDLIDVIRKHKIKKVYFTSKKVETWFERLFPESDDLTKITLISPSAQSVRSLVKRSDFKAWISVNTERPKFEYILQDYQQKFDSDA